MSKTLTIIGVTGLIGSHLYELLKQDKTVETIRLIVRRPMRKDDDRTEIKLVDFNDAESLLLAISGSDLVFCTVGTTQRKVKGDKDAYRKVDYDIPVKAARFCKMTECETLVLVSSVGADSKSKNFYLKLKGEVEDAIKEVGLKSVHTMRPSMLLGDRKEFRLGEKIGKGLMAAFSFLIPSKYKPMHAKDVAKAMIAAAKEKKDGFFVYEYKEMKSMIL
ncbi:MAG TPA: NAD(P)H-binding protein [Chitinophagaceae bacterium]|nr:NAD(P)H-binding protein [Chitinophagaceae bacterium]